jgi:hypothetical protein
LSRASYPFLSIPSSTIGSIVPISDLAVEDLVGDLGQGGAAGAGGDGVEGVDATKCGLAVAG